MTDPGTSSERLTPRVRLSTVAALLALTGAVAVLGAAIGMAGGFVGDRGMTIWLYGTVLSLVAGVPTIPLAIGGTSQVPAWQWAGEAVVGGAACLVAVVAGIVVLF